MNIIIEENKAFEVRFDSLDILGCFNYRGNMYMKIQEIEIELGTVRNAIGLTGNTVGKSYQVYPDTHVIEMDSKLTLSFPNERK